MARNVLVYADWSGMDQPALVGLLTADVVRGKEVFSFEYARSILVNLIYFIWKVSKQVVHAKQSG